MRGCTGKRNSWEYPAAYPNMALMAWLKLLVSTPLHKNCTIAAPEFISVWLREIWQILWCQPAYISNREVGVRNSFSYVKSSSLSIIWIFSAQGLDNTPSPTGWSRSADLPLLSYQYCAGLLAMWRRTTWWGALPPRRLRILFDPHDTAVVCWTLRDLNLI